MIPLMKNCFLQEQQTKRELADFILRTDRLSMWEQCALFEAEFAAYQGSRDAVLFNSGGSANLAMIQALKNLGQLTAGDAVAFSGLTWSTNVMPIIQLGLVPIPIDCDPHTLNASSTTFLERLEQVDIRAFFITNALSLAGDLARIREVCAERDILLIEDNCEGLGTILPEGKTGTFGAMASFSFFVAHHMSTIEGGMVCTDDERLAEMLRIVRANGWDRNLQPEQQAALRSSHGGISEFDAKYKFYDLGYNLRPTEITGFLGRSQLRLLEENVGRRAELFAELESTYLANASFLPLRHDHLSRVSSFAFPVLCKHRADRAAVLARFTEAGVETRPMIAGNIQTQPFYKKYQPTLYPLPGTETIDASGFYFGLYPDLETDDLATLHACLASRS